MPPRIALPHVGNLSRPSTTIATFLVPFVNLQIRSASILGSLSDNASAYSKPKRVGRGPSSGKGKTSGRGMNGQKARGKVPKNFTGGQTKESVAHGKLGFTNVHAIDLQEVNVDKIQEWINQNRLDPTKPITLRELCKSKIIRVKPGSDGVKLLARNAEGLKTPIHVIVSRASAAAIEAVESVGGTVTTRYYTPSAVQRIRSGVMHSYISQRWDPAAIGNTKILPRKGYGMKIEERVTGLGYQYRLPDPTSRKDLEYYRDAKNRGYLSHTVAENETPSLFWKAHVSRSEINAKRQEDPEAKRKQREAETLF